jgi:site-specific DNA-cytosine methylase
MVEGRPGPGPPARPGVTGAAKTNLAALRPAGTCLPLLAHQSPPLPGCSCSGATALTLDELAAVQDFPPGYRFAGTHSSIARQIGNAVPVGLAAAVVGALAGSSEEGRSGSDLAPGEQGLIAELLALSREELAWLKGH